MDIEDLKRQLTNTVEVWFSQQNKSESVSEGTAEFVKPERTDGKRAARTKSTGDRVYLIDDNAKTKAWVTSPEILEKLGFEMADVVDLNDEDLISYQMAPSIYRVDE